VAIAAGADLKLVQRMLGHADATMTLNTYADLWPDRLDDVSNAASSSCVPNKIWRSARRSVNVTGSTPTGVTRAMVPVESQKANHAPPSVVAMSVTRHP
jgi:hypothetical protein